MVLPVSSVFLSLVWQPKPRTKTKGKQRTAIFASTGSALDLRPPPDFRSLQCMVVTAKKCQVNAGGQPFWLNPITGPWLMPIAWAENSRGLSNS
jgi:hypothetical protein